MGVQDVFLTMMARLQKATVAFSTRIAENEFSFSTEKRLSCEFCTISFSSVHIQAKTCIFSSKSHAFPHFWKHTTFLCWRVFAPLQHDFWRFIPPSASQSLWCTPDHVTFSSAPCARCQPCCQLEHTQRLSASVWEQQDGYISWIFYGFSSRFVFVVHEILVRLESIQSNSKNALIIFIDVIFVLLLRKICR